MSKKLNFIENTDFTEASFLSPEEKKIINLLKGKMPPKEIAYIFSCSNKTIYKKISKIENKYEVFVFMENNNDNSHPKND